MDSVLSGIALTWTCSYLIKYSIEYAATTVVKKTASTVATSVKREVGKHMFPCKDIIEYELIMIDEQGEPVTDEMVIVTSRERKKIEHSWIITDKELLTKSVISL